jgi:hypothetical protein
MDGDDFQHVHALAAVVQRIVDESGDPAGFDALAWTLGWVHVPVPALGGARPLDCMKSAEGRALVESVVLRMQSGAYS